MDREFPALAVQVFTHCMQLYAAQHAQTAPNAKLRP